MISLFCFGYVMLSPDLVYAITAEFKCTTKCNLCITYPKKTVCSEKYSEDTEDYEKGRKLSRFVNDGLIIPTTDLKPGFSLSAFSKKFFNCDLMVKKVVQIQDATQQMCVNKTASRKKSASIFRQPATKTKVVPPVKKKSIKSNAKATVPSKAYKSPVTAKKSIPPSAVPVTGNELGDMIEQIDEQQEE